MWCPSSGDRVCIRWSLPVSGYPGSAVNFAARLYPGGEIEFLYGQQTGDASFCSWSGVSAGDDENYDLATNWDISGLAGTSWIFRPKTFPDGTILSESGLLTVTDADPTALYEIPVRVSDCYTVFDQKTFILKYTGIGSKTEESLLKIFPNPAKDVINIDIFGYPEEDVQFTVYDIGGRKVFGKSFRSRQGKGQYSLDLGGLEGGLYILNIRSSSFERSEKLVIQ
jgi:hypothetical protein